MARGLAICAEHGGHHDPVPLALEQRLGAHHENLAVLRQADAAGGPMQQADPQPVFETAHRLAQCRRTRTAGTGGIPESARLCDGQEGVQITKVGLHCSSIRTACADYAGL